MLVHRDALVLLRHRPTACHIRPDLVSLHSNCLRPKHGLQIEASVGMLNSGAAV